MKALFRNSLLTALLLVFFLIFSGSAFTADLTLDYYRIYGNSPYLELEDFNPGGHYWKIFNDKWGPSHSFSIDSTSEDDEYTWVPFIIESNCPNDLLYLDSRGRIGIKTNDPMANLHLAAGGSNATFLFETYGNGWYMLNKYASGRFNITDDPTFARVPFKIGVGAKQNLLKMGCGATDEVYISGNLVVAGTFTPDYVFEDRYPLRSIEEHADLMWKEKHLPAVEKAKVDEEGKGVVNLGKRSQELLEELETAHIYIQQLNQKIKALESLNSMMGNKMKAFEKRLSEIES